MRIESLYYYISNRLNRLYMQKNRGLITPQEFYAEQQMILLEFSSGIKDDVYERMQEDIQEKQLLKIESELQ
ncbi:hypothetical protein UFOVP573_57 [uncultured Caudovirales phage]|uniref:Uncharacterized protein n=1 Tax=uncultured Caudovirales phage TaxID=2100421 RepID=A0A6J5NWN1_9CAUD|nr:hypothetical protein UFOVP288_58 [uncultured Caudovirales phage]CAB4146176.1 hypothetical protein UFOVP483_138 [uncultured Caudovirales phage]CAB4150904.1 hypothetical protein UFOVP573_57 [uncultured Caudovirales phage]CAB4161498.1 hypothetical protein UFOVP769_58 [uncultured Caudovirales phage]CAB4174110.1 hypothetical protein UFOVP962_26 [uncultured Caudovirales phage]